MQTSQQFQALQQGVLGEEKWEASATEGICCVEEILCTPAREKGCLMLLGEERESCLILKGIQPDPFRMEREFHFPTLD